MQRVTRPCLCTHFLGPVCYTRLVANDDSIGRTGRRLRGRRNRSLGSIHVIRSELTRCVEREFAWHRMDGTAEKTPRLQDVGLVFKFACWQVKWT
jgi:hypothetical protein